MKIRKYLELYKRDLVTCAPDDSVQDTAQRFSSQHICGAPVCNEDGQMLGIVSERDLVRALGEKGRDAVKLHIRDVMTEKVTKCSPDDPMSRARQIMYDKGFRNVPVVEGQSVVGVIGVRDALKVRLDQKELEVNVLKDTVIAARGG